MKVLDVINKRIEKLKSSIKPEMTNEELQAIQEEIKDLEESRTEVEKMNTNLAKYKDKLLDIVMNTGGSENSDDKHKNFDDPGANEPKSLEDVIQEACDAKDKQGGK